MPKLTYLVAATLDGFIAGPHGETEHLYPDPAALDGLVREYPETMPTPARSAMSIDVPNRRFDTVIMGRATYQVGADQGLMSPYAHLRQFVVSSSLRSAPDPAIEVVRDDPQGLVRQLKDGQGAGIWLCGGGKLAAALVDEIDELILKRHPTLVGAGIPLFDGDFEVRRFRLLRRTDLGDLSVEQYERTR